MADRVAAVRADRDREARRHAAADAGALPRGRRARAAAAAFLTDWKRGSIEGFLFPALVRVHAVHDAAASSSPISSRAFRKRFAQVDLSYARSKNLTPYDVLIIASMIEKETVVPRERRLVAAVIYNRLRQNDAARDRRDDPLRPEHSGHRSR